MGNSRWKVPETVCEQASRMIEIERALWVHRLSGRQEAVCALAIIEQAVDRGWPTRARPRARVERLVRSLERRLRASSFGSPRWHGMARALARLLVAQGRAHAFRLGESVDQAIGSLAPRREGSAQALVAGARERHLALRQDLVAGLMPTALHVASLCAVVSGARIEQLVNVAVASLGRAVDSIDPESAGDYERAVLRAVDRAVGHHLEGVPRVAPGALAPSMDGGF